MGSYYSIDLGSGFIKALNEKGEQVLFPSVFGTRINYSGISEFFGINNDYLVKLNETEFYVGDLALINRFERRWEEEPSVEDLQIFIGTAITALFEESKVKYKFEDTDIISVDTLAVGLPINFFQRYGHNLKENLTGLSFEMSINRGKERKIEIKQAIIFVQGLGAYNYAIKDLKGNIKNLDLINRPVGYIEIGYKTTDFFILERGKRNMEIIEGCTGTFDKEGMIFVQQYVQEQLLSKNNLSIDLPDIEKALEWSNGNLDINAGKIFNVNEYWSEGCKKLASVIINKLNQRWKDYVLRLPLIIISGGGGQALYPEILKTYKQAKLQENAQFANSFGYLIEIIDKSAPDKEEIPKEVKKSNGKKKSEKEAI